MKKRKYCANCGKPIKDVYMSPYFCFECDVVRIEYLSDVFEGLEKHFQEQDKLLHGKPRQEPEKKEKP